VILHASSHIAVSTPPELKTCISSLGCDIASPLHTLQSLRHQCWNLYGLVVCSFPLGVIVCTCEPPTPNEQSHHCCGRFSVACSEDSYNSIIMSCISKYIIFVRVLRTQVGTNSETDSDINLLVFKILTDIIIILYAYQYCQHIKSVNRGFVPHLLTKWSTQHRQE